MNPQNNPNPDEPKVERDTRGEAAGEPALLDIDEETLETELPDEVDDVEENMFPSAAEGNDEM